MDMCVQKPAVDFNANRLQPVDQDLRHSRVGQQGFQRTKAGEVVDELAQNHRALVRVTDALLAQPSLNRRGHGEAALGQVIGEGD